MADATGLWLEAAGRVPLLTDREELELGRLANSTSFGLVTRGCRVKVQSPPPWALPESD
jgi:hypothetical protein